MDTNPETIEAQPAPPPEPAQPAAPASLNPFRQSGFLAEGGMRKLRARHEAFVQALFSEQ